jgi:hypothetical protein
VIGGGLERESRAHSSETSPPSPPNAADRAGLPGSNQRPPPSQGVSYGAGTSLTAGSKPDVSPVSTRHRPSGGLVLARMCHAWRGLSGADYRSERVSLDVAFLLRG